MANPKILAGKQSVIDEITNNVKESSSFIFLDNILSKKINELDSLTLFVISSITDCLPANIFGFAIIHLLTVVTE